MAERRFDLEERTESFALRVRALIRQMLMDICNEEDCRQLVRASGSVAANYIEANDALGKKDFRMKIKICRRESKESRLFLRCLEVGGRTDLAKERGWLVQEATEFISIFSAILKKTEGSD